MTFDITIGSNSAFLLEGGGGGGSWRKSGLKLHIKQPGIWNICLGIWTNITW